MKKMLTYFAKHDVFTNSLFGMLFLLALQCLYNYLHSAKGYPYNTFLVDPRDRFGDHTKAILSFLPVRTGMDPSGWPALFQKYFYTPDYKGIEGLKTGEVTNLAAPPFRTALALLWGQLMRITGPVIELCTAVTIYFTLAFSVTRLVAKPFSHRLAMLGLLAFSYPALMILDRGNLDAGFAGLCVIVFFTSLLKQKDWLAILVLAVAVNMHPNLLALCLAAICFYWPKKIRILRFLVGIGIAAAAIFTASLGIAHALYPDYTLSNFLLAVSTYNNAYVMQDAGLAYGSSLVGGLKGLGIDSINVHYVNYGILGALGAALFFARIKQKVTFNECAYLCITYSLLFCPVIADYNLIIFVVPAMLVYMTGKPLTQYGNLALLIIVVLLLAPKSYEYLYGNVSYQVIFNPLLMLVAVGIIFTNIGLRFATAHGENKMLENNVIS